MIGCRQNQGAVSEKAIQPYMLLLKPDKIAIIVLHELTHILMQSPAGNTYSFCCENVGKIIKVYFFRSLYRSRKPLLNSKMTESGKRRRMRLF